MAPLEEPGHLSRHTGILMTDLLCCVVDITPGTDRLWKCHLGA